MKQYLILGVLAVVGLGGVAYVARADGLSLDKVPAPSRHMLQELFPQAEIIKIEADTDDGVTVYKFKLREDGRKIKVKIDSQGQLVECEGELSEAQVPAEVRHQLREQFPQAKIVKVKCDHDDGQQVYKITVDQHGCQIKVKLTAAGHLLTDRDG